MMQKAVYLINVVINGGNDANNTSLTSYNISSTSVTAVADN